MSTTNKERLDWIEEIDYNRSGGSIFNRAIIKLHRANRRFCQFINYNRFISRCFITLKYRWRLLCIYPEILIEAVYILFIYVLFGKTDKVVKYLDE